MVKGEKAPKALKPPYQITFFCNECNERFDMYPRGDQRDSVICSCGRKVESYLDPMISAKMSKRQKPKDFD